jgi:nicotinamide riboside kinase
LLDIDVPWVADGVRNRPTQRDEVHQLFVDTLARLDMPVQLVNGTWDARFAAAVRLIDWRQSG